MGQGLQRVPCAVVHDLPAAEETLRGGGVGGDDQDVAGLGVEEIKAADVLLQITTIAVEDLALRGLAGTLARAQEDHLLQMWEERGDLLDPDRGGRRWGKNDAGEEEGDPLLRACWVTSQRPRSE